MEYELITTEKHKLIVKETVDINQNIKPAHSTPIIPAQTKFNGETVPLILLGSQKGVKILCASSGKYLKKLKWSNNITINNGRMANITMRFKEGILYVIGYGAHQSYYLNRFKLKNYSQLDQNQWDTYSMRNYQSFGDFIVYIDQRGNAQKVGITGNKFYIIRVYGKHNVDIEEYKIDFLTNNNGGHFIDDPKRKRLLYLLFGKDYFMVFTYEMIGKLWKKKNMIIDEYDIIFIPSDIPNKPMKNYPQFLNSNWRIPQFGHQLSAHIVCDDYLVLWDIVQTKVLFTNLNNFKFLTELHLDPSIFEWTIIMPNCILSEQVNSMIQIWKFNQLRSADFELVRNLGLNYNYFKPRAEKEYIMTIPMIDIFSDSMLNLIRKPWNKKYEMYLTRTLREETHLNNYPMQLLYLIIQFINPINKKYLAHN